MIFEVSSGRPLTGAVAIPGDKSVSHRALILASLAGGTSEVRHLSDGEDVRRTAAAVAALGARLETVERSPGGISYSVGGGPRRLHEACSPLDLGNSGTGLRLLAGLAAGFPWLTILTGDASLIERPMERITLPLVKMGARVEGRQDGAFPPLVVRGGNLNGIDFTPPVASAQVKSAVLLAGLRAEGDTIVREPVATRTHTEELLQACGANIHIARDTTAGGTGQVITLSPGPLDPFSVVVPGDPSQAAFWVVAAALVPGSEVHLTRIYAGAQRIGFVDVLRRMGADVTLGPSDAEDPRVSDIHVRYAGALRGTDMSGDEIPGLDEIPVLAIAAAAAEGTSTFSGLEELRGKETDRLATVSALVGGLGGTVEIVDASGLRITGGRLNGGTVDSRGDHRIAMAAAVAGLVASGPVRVSGWEAVATSYPLFADHLRRLGWQRGT